MGAMQVLEWAASYPDSAFAAVPIAGAARHSAHNIGFHEVGRQAIMADPDWCGGRYLSLDRKPVRGLAVARMAAHITYLPKRHCTANLGTNLQDRLAVTYGFDADFQVESYLRHQGSTFVDRFDAIPTSTSPGDGLLRSGGGTRRIGGRRVRDAHARVSASSHSPATGCFRPRKRREIVHALNAAAANDGFVEIATDDGVDAFLLPSRSCSRPCTVFRTAALSTAASAAPSNGRIRRRRHAEFRRGCGKRRWRRAPWGSCARICGRSPR